MLMPQPSHDPVPAEAQEEEKESLKAARMASIILNRYCSVLHEVGVTR